MRQLVAFGLSALSALHVASAADYFGFGNSQYIPKIINDDKMDVTLEIDFHLSRTAEGNHPQKFYFVPDDPPQANPRMVVLLSSGQLRLYDSLNSDPYKYNEFLDIDAEVYWDGFHSMAFDPQWPASPYIYIYYIGYTNLPSLSPEYPNKTLRGGRPTNFNTPPGNRGGCWLVDDKSNYNALTNLCPNYKYSTAGCSPLSYYCEMFSRVDRIKLDPTTFAVLYRTKIYGSGRSCGGFWGHHWSNILFLSDDSMVFGMGDHSIDTVAADPGEPGGDMCYFTDEGAPQGHWRPQRDFTDIGKFLRVRPGLFRTATGALQYGKDYEIIAKGTRNPYSVHLMPDDSIWIGDVGNGEAERIYHIDARGSAAGSPIRNFGWPCIEGEIGELLGSYSEQQRVKYLKNNGFTICDRIYKAAGVNTSNYVGDPKTTVADVNYLSPHFEFREVIDTSYSGCRGSRAAISGITYNDGSTVGLRYKNRIFFSDHSKRCLFYGAIGDDGKLTNVKALLEGGDVGISHLLIHPADGRLLLLDYEHSRIISLKGGSDEGGDPDPGNDDRNTISIPPAAAPPVTKINPVCTVGFNDNLKTFGWVDSGKGYLEGTLKLGSIQYTNEYGETRTRGFNGGLPGPIIRMEACNVYKLTVANDLYGWYNPTTGTVNSFHEPLPTNLHTHGLHISGEGDADNVSRKILPGESAVYTYAIPCDHAGGTHFYHPHKHGAVTLQAGAGAVGLLIVEDNPYHEVQGKTPIYSTMPVHHMVIEFMDPDFTYSVAQVAEDMVYDTTATKSHFLLNGCTKYKFNVRRAIWTRIRMLFVGRSTNVAVSLRDGTGEFACKSAVLAKDGVYSSPAGRIILSEYFFTVSSRVDVAIYCENAGTYNVEIEKEGITGRTIVGTVNVVDSGGATDSNTLDLWTPCRPYYLQDLQSVTADASGFAVILGNGDINGALFTNSAFDVMVNIDAGTVQEWTISGSDLHPYHQHVNHMQLQVEKSSALVDGWYQKGDWVDTVSMDAAVPVKFRADRYGGRMIMHCHIYEHSDAGMIREAYINGGSGAYNVDISIANPVACSIAPLCNDPPTGQPWCPGGSPVTLSDPTCSKGTLHSDGVTCCSSTCESCGGVNCAQSTGGAANCCASAISANGRSCNDTIAPCTIDLNPPNGGGDPTCAKGILHPNGSACCAATCQRCGAPDCASDPGGGATSCCNSGIVAQGRNCNNFEAPCEITKKTTPPVADSDPYCTNGILHPNGKACCAPTCTRCGATDCTSDPGGGAASCCGSGILQSGRNCNNTVAPCMISDPAPPVGADPTCSTGTIHSNGVSCCSASCTNCGGADCASDPGGGAANCCASAISKNGMSCDTAGPPCTIGGGTGGGGGGGGGPDPKCTTGILHYNGVACCAATCQRCGGADCASDPGGGAASCCSSGITASGLSCNTYGPPCIVGGG